MKNITCVLLFGLLFGCVSVIAHEGHDHSYITETSALTVAREYSIQLIGKKGEFEVNHLDESWRKVSSESVRLHTNGDGYYIVTVANQLKQQTLYVLMTSNGDVYGANFTGEFAILKKE